MAEHAYPHPIKRWLIPILGATQTTARPTGLERLWMRLREASKPRQCVVTPRVWDDDWAGFAAFIARNSVDQPIVDVVSYSWGAGFGCVQLATELGKLPAPISVRHAVLADPVYRNPSVPRWLNIRALLNRNLAPSITIPANVQKVTWTRQLNNKPQAHDLKAEDPAATRIHDPYVRRDLEHADMDDDPLFHSLAVSVLEINP